MTTQNSSTTVDTYELSTYVRAKLPDLKKVLSQKCLKPVKNILEQTYRRYKMKKRSRNTIGNTNLLKMLNEIIHNNYFGCTANRKIFYRIVKMIATRSKSEFIHSALLTKNVQYNKILWLDNVPEAYQSHALKACTIYLLDIIVKPLINHFYFNLATLKTQEIIYVERPKWQSFKYKSLRKLEKLGFFELSPKVSPRRSRGKLKMIPQNYDCSSEEFRPIIRLNDYEIKLEYYKELITKIKAAAKLKNPIKNRSLFDFWKSCSSTFHNSGRYAIKVDIKDAFGQVDLKLLAEILKTRDTLTEHDKKFLLKHITEQYITIKVEKKKEIIGIWKHGLLQGDRLSPSLCELYLAFLDSIYLSNWVSSNDTKLLRTADDYLFVTNEEYKTDVFLNEIKSIHTINDDKKIIVVSSSKSCEISYCGYILNIKTGQVRTDYKIKNNNYRYQFKLFNLRKHLTPISNNGKDFFCHSLQFCVACHVFSVFKFKTTRENLVQNYFFCMIYFAYRCDVILSHIRLYHGSNACLDLIPDLIERFVMKSTYMLAKYNEITINTRLLKAITYRAFILVFKRRSKCYEKIIPVLKRKKNRIDLGSIKVDVRFFNKMPDVFKRVQLNRKMTI